MSGVRRWRERAPIVWGSRLGASVVLAEMRVPPVLIWAARRIAGERRGPAGAAALATALLSGATDATTPGAASRYPARRRNARRESDSADVRLSLFLGRPSIMTLRAPF